MQEPRLRRAGLRIASCLSSFHATITSTARPHHAPRLSLRALPSRSALTHRAGRGNLGPPDTRPRHARQRTALRALPLRSDLTYRAGRGNLGPPDSRLRHARQRTALRALPLWSDLTYRAGRGNLASSLVRFLTSPVPCLSPRFPQCAIPHGHARIRAPNARYRAHPPHLAATTIQPHFA